MSQATVRRLDVPFELKSANEEEGRIIGYGSVFGNVDLAGDVVVRGAFAHTLKDSDGEVPLLWQHKWDEPIGLCRLREDPKGLHVDAAIDMEIPEGRRAFRAAKLKLARGLSIGYDTRKANMRRDGVRELLELKLWEVSVVTFPCNVAATVERTKERPETMDDVYAALKNTASAMRLQSLKWRIDALDRRLNGQQEGRR